MPIDGGGQLVLEHLATIIVALSSLDPSFWTSNSELRAILVDAFPRLHAWIIILADLVASRQPPVQIAPRRLQALCLIHNSLWVIRNVGLSGPHSVGNLAGWDNITSMWLRSRDLTLQEEGWLALNFNHAKDAFVLNNETSSDVGFLRKLLDIMQEHRFEGGEVLHLSLSRVRRALDNGASPEAAIFLHQHLLVLFALIHDNDEFNPDESPFHLAFFAQSGLTFVLETMTLCAGSSRWASADICIAIVAAFLRRTRSHTVFRMALETKVIRRLMQISCHSGELLAKGRDAVAFLLSKLLPEMMVSQSLVELAGDMELPDLELNRAISRCVYRKEWDHLMRVRRHFFYAYLSVRIQHERCGNVRKTSLYFILLN